MMQLMTVASKSLPLILALLLAMTASGSAAVLRIEMRPISDGEPLVLNATPRHNAAGESFSVARLSYLMSGVALRRVDGTWHELAEQVAWMDASRRREAMTLPEVPVGKYTALRFQIGLDAAVNARDTGQYEAEHPLNPNLNGLLWPMQGGYIFLALEGKWTAENGIDQGYALHLAREPFRTVVELPTELELGSSVTIRLDLDVPRLLQGLSFARDGATTHSRDGDVVAERLKRNLAQAFIVKETTVGTAVVTAPTAQPPAIPASLFTKGAQFPMPALPADNPLTADRIALGRRLFHEGALSRDGTVSCASCHVAGAALSDPRQFSTGVEGRLGNRNGMPLFNLAWKREFFWDGRAPSLRAQALMPIVDHREMDETLERVVEKLSGLEGYAAEFERAFGAAEITPERVGLALENFLLTLTSHDSKFDRAQRGEVKLTADEQRGFELFNMEREPRLGAMGADCFHCHGGPLFTDHQFRNNGLAITEADTGRHVVTRAGIDKGAFATPSLRNIALTAPYMHDGRFATLEEVIEHYSTGVQPTATLDPNLAKHPVGGLNFSAEDKRCLVAFLKTLTDEGFTQRAAALTKETKGADR